jgi:hypothetical protein
MRSRNWYNQNRSRLLKGLPESNSGKLDFEELKQTEWSEDFEKLMRNRLLLGSIRYGRLHAHGKPQYNRVESIINRMKKYERTGNKEFLVDCANLCLLEFEECHHINAHFASIDDGEHVQIS